MTDRDTGMTKMQLESVIEMMEGPQTVLYVWPEINSIRYPAELMAFLMKKRGIRFTARGPNYIPSIYIPDTCAWLHFVSMERHPETQMFQHSPGSIVLDHACLDLNIDKAFTWFWACDRYAMQFPELYLNV